MTPAATDRPAEPGRPSRRRTAAVGLRLPLRADPRSTDSADQVRADAASDGAASRRPTEAPTSRRATGGPAPRCGSSWSPPCSPSMTVALLLVGAASVVALQSYLVDRVDGQLDAIETTLECQDTHAAMTSPSGPLPERLRGRRSQHDRRHRSCCSIQATSRAAAAAGPAGATCRPGQDRRATTSPSTAGDRRGHWRVKVTDYQGRVMVVGRGSVRCGLRRRPPDPHRDAGRRRRPARARAGQRLDGPAEPATAGGHRAHGRGDRRRRPDPARARARPEHRAGSALGGAEHDADPDRVGLPGPRRVGGAGGAAPRSGCASSSPTPRTSCARR